MNESTETTKALKYLNHLPGCFAFRITPGVYGSRGKSDIILCYRGLFVAIEMKVGSNKPSDQQERFLHDVQIKGEGLSVACWSSAEVEEYMECISMTMNDVVNTEETIGENLLSLRDMVIDFMMTSKLTAVKKGYLNMRKTSPLKP